MEKAWGRFTSRRKSINGDGGGEAVHRTERPLGDTNDESNGSPNSHGYITFYDSWRFCASERPTLGLEGEEGGGGGGGGGGGSGGGGGGESGGNDDDDDGDGDGCNTDGGIDNGVVVVVVVGGGGGGGGGGVVVTVTVVVC